MYGRISLFTKVAIPILLLLPVGFFVYHHVFHRTGNLVGEAGTTQLYHPGISRWHQIRLKNQYVNPVVIARILSDGTEHPMLTQVKNVRHGGFELWVERRKNLASENKSVTVHYVVFEAGTYRLGDGRLVEAGFTSGNPMPPGRVFSGSADNQLVVLTQDMETVHKPVQLRDRLPLVSSYVPTTINGYPAPKDRNVAFVAIESGRGKTNGKRYEVLKKPVRPNVVQTYVFSTAFRNPPVHILGFQDSGSENLPVDLVSVTSTRFQIQVKRPSAVPISDLTFELGYLAIEAGPILSGSLEAIRPYVRSITPNDHEKEIRRDASIRIGFHLPNKGQKIDLRTVNEGTVRLFASGSRDTYVPFSVNQRTGQNIVEIQPSTLLEKNTNYVLEMTNGIMDESGAPIEPYKIRFSTGLIPNHSPGGIRFEPIKLEGTVGRHTSLALGPDGKLYASTFKGYIRRWTINQDGTLRKLETFNTIRKAEKGNRLMIGLAFDPHSTPDNPILWVSHTAFGFVNCPDWSGKITRISGKNLERAEDMVINLPRSVQDHVTNSLAFGPDGALYVTQGSNSAMGAPDTNWGTRKEHLLTAAVLRIDVEALQRMKLPLDARTEEGGTYNPYLPDAPVRLFATGLRNAYDLVWHSNGNLYVPVNGSNENGAAPASVNGTLRPDGSRYNGQEIPALQGVESQPDYLARIPGPVNGAWEYRYYGHPNPSRGEYVLNGGNPSTDADAMQVDEYPVGITPDASWQGVAYEIGDHFSANGIIEYRSSTFNGKLKGSLLVARFSSSDDILVLTPDAGTGNIREDRVIVGVEGFDQLDNPLDLVENPANGNLYVSLFGGEGHLVLMKPIETAFAGAR